MMIEKKLEAKEEAELVKLKEDMNIELFTFSKTLKASALHKALDLKKQLEDKGKPPHYFRVAVRNLWAKGFKHDDVANYVYTQDKLGELDIAEKNLNRNIDSHA